MPDNSADIKQAHGKKFLHLHKTPRLGNRTPILWAMLVNAGKLHVLWIVNKTQETESRVDQTLVQEPKSVYPSPQALLHHIPSPTMDRWTKATHLPASICRSSLHRSQRVLCGLLGPKWGVRSRESLPGGFSDLFSVDQDEEGDRAKLNSLSNSSCCRSGNTQRRAHSFPWA